MTGRTCNTSSHALETQAHGSRCSGGEPPVPADAWEFAGLKTRLEIVLREDGATLPDDELVRLAHELRESIRYRNVVTYRWRRMETLGKDDILYLIHQANAAGDRNEMIWRAFLAAHFGRASTDRRTPGQPDSVAWVLCGSGTEPVWTWAAVSRCPSAFCDWLHAHQLGLAQIRFGNHRKREAKKPEALWQVIESFLAFVSEHGGTPAEALRPGWDPGRSPSRRFDDLYQLLLGLHRFHRLGAFDFVMLLVDLGLLDAEPKSCYLIGSSGPLKGAKRIWRGRSEQELEHLAAALARRLEVSPVVVEDALCNWQKTKGLG